MSFRTILVHAEASDDGIKLLTSAAELAARNDGHLVALLVRPDPPAAYVGMMDVPLTGYTRELEIAREELREETEKVEAVLQRLGGSFEVRARSVPEGLLGTEFARHARYADISVFSPRNEDEYWYQFFDTALLESGRPVLLCPKGAGVDFAGKRVMVAWDAGQAATRALHDAMPVIAAASDVRVVLVDPQISPSRHGGMPGANIATVLARHRVDVTVETLASTNRDYSGALLMHARESGCDVIVSGAYGHSRIGQMLLGGVTRDLAESTDRPILMSH